MIDRDLRRPTPAERLWLWRRTTSLTQADAAARLGVPLRRYQRAEAGENSVQVPRGAPRPTLGDLCALARRRSRLGLRAAAARLGISHVTLLAWERGSDPRLVEGWRVLGFRP